MRYFPSAHPTVARSTEGPALGTPARRRHRRALGASLALAVLVSGWGLSSPASADDDLKDQQKAVQGKIADAHDDLDHSSAASRKAAQALSKARAELTAANALLSAAQAKVSAAQAKDQQMQTKLLEAEQRLQTASSDLEAGKADLSEQADKVADVVTNIYQEGDPTLRALSSFMNARTPADWARTSAVQDVAVQSETGSYDELRAAKVLLQVKKKQVAQAKDEVEALRQEAADHLVEMQNLETDQQHATDAVASKVSNRRAARSAADAAKAADAATLKRLEAQSKRIADKLRAQALAAGATTTVPTANDTGGALRKPVDGYVTSPYGYRTHPIYGYYSLHDGADFGAACGTPMYATEDGVVESSYWSSVYGNRLVLNHGLVKGVGLASIYNHATSYVVSPGQRVKRGQLMGYVGTTGWSTGCHLHFTLLVNGNTVNPVNWF